MMFAVTPCSLHSPSWYGSGLRAEAAMVEQARKSRAKQRHKRNAPWMKPSAFNSTLCHHGVCGRVQDLRPRSLSSPSSLLQLSATSGNGRHCGLWCESIPGRSVSGCKSATRSWIGWVESGEWQQGIQRTFCSTMSQVCHALNDRQTTLKLMSTSAMFLMFSATACLVFKLSRRWHTALTSYPSQPRLWSPSCESPTCENTACF